MEFTVTQRLICGLTIPDGKSLAIDGFTFLPDFEGEHQARHLQTTVESQTKEEATIKARKLFNDFLAKLTLIDDSRYILEENLSVFQVGGASPTTHTVTVSTGAFIIQDGNRIKSIYETSFRQCRPRKTPLRLYREAINTDNPLEKYKAFYRVMECYYGKTKEITNWIKSQIRNPKMKKNKEGKNITIYTWLRIKLSHSKSTRKDLAPFLISNPQHIAVVRSYLPKIQELARLIIKEEEKA